ncbi:DEAD/DEAH box helicase family protein [Brachybacterium muris]|uniref:DEAD/DEAH box helicase n=1 Tax=Brachybacterium muris TaxID=219301 RepID=UPI00223AA44C|nr:type ISP restriction/modification enzyme [Brachybacterium muris]MCT2178821.1 DEAD/DEAH box helicase family protein [Brachybacterium muris]
MTAVLSPMKLLDRMYNSSSSETDKGTRFERFVQSFLQTDPVWAEQFSKVWMWDDWPEKTGHDTGIDLVAERRDGGRTAIQCKFYAPTHHMSKGDIDSFLAKSGRIGFTERLIVSTTTKWGPNAEDAIRDQAVPVRRLGLDDFEQSRVDWATFDPDTPTVLSLTEGSDLRPYQRTAINDVVAGFREHDRGRLIMACGTGKTFTSLRLAEEYVGSAGSVLFLVPSIALLSQALREWSNQTTVGMTAMAVCSDRKASRTRRASEDTSEISVVDLALPATTDPETLAGRMRESRTDGEGMRVVFATYQSIDVVAQAQKIAGLAPFDLIICDEAHRTTGATLVGEDESPFVRVHDENYLKASKRLYMTATPRIYDDASKAKAGRAQAVLASMDDEDTFGPEMYRLGFGDAVSMGMLTDYKVLILTVNQESVNEAMQEAFAENGELTLDDATRLIGCWNGLAKRGDAEHSFGLDAQPMKRAVAFARSIKDSKRVKSQFNEVVSAYVENHDGEDVDDLLQVEVEHVDGTMNAMERNAHLDWLREPTPENHCRVLTNARCLSEGVDVPSLDAVMFLNPRKSVVDVVQSVGRVMRLSQGKKFGYIILPVVVPAGSSPESALDDNKNFRVVWEVLQALRAHDERFDAMVNKVELNRKRDDKVNVIGVGFGGDNSDEGGAPPPGESAQGRIDLRLSQMDSLRDAIYAKMVTKVGSRHYWDQWAKDIAQIAQAHIARITALVDDPSTAAANQFSVFLDALRRNLNESISRDGAIEMLAQHMITKPVFDALFEDYAFTASNPVSQVMDRMVQALTAMHVDVEAASLEAFYESVRLRAAGIDNAEGKQKIITELYESFFKSAFAKTADSMGVVYTPVEIVDFILRSVDDVLKKEFGRSISDKGVHVLDPFTGTGTFIVRLLQSGLIKPEDLARKYAGELHANEILLLAYYIAAINIETTYHDLAAEADGVTLEEEAYEPFSGIVLTDTFQLTEDGDLQDERVFPANNSRAETQKKLDIQVIVGNPPYSVGQTSGNDDNANVKYPTLDARVRDTFAARTDATNKNSLYDSYIRAIRWASDRVGDEGVIGFVTNGGWIEGNTAAGVRKTLADEFSSIYVFNLRGNARTAGVQRQKEKGNVFGSGGRTTIAVFLLVRTKDHAGPATIHYRDIGDYLTAKEKLAIVDESTLDTVPWRPIEPNRHGDWINQRDEDYLTYPILGGKGADGVSVFDGYSAGLQTNRDAWVYNSSRTALGANLARFIETYDAERTRFSTYATAQNLTNPKGADTVGVVSADETRIKWNRSLRDRLAKGLPLTRQPDRTTLSLYRPFMPQHIDHSDGLVYLPAVARRYFPTAKHDNYGFYVTGVGSDKEFSVLASRLVPDLALWGSSNGQFFPRYRWEPVAGPEDGALDLSIASAPDVVVGGYRRIDNISDEILAHVREHHGNSVTKDDVFYFVYGLLHSPEYRERYAGELKQMLPRVPNVPAGSFSAFTDAGRELFHLHADYEDAELYPLEIIGGERPPLGGPEAAADYYRVQKMRFPSGQKAADVPGSLIVNGNITVTGIPEAAYRYQLGSRSAIEWLIRQYQVTTDKASGIVNDPNQWGIEHGNPRYILDLLQKVITVSVRTVEITESLPSLQGASQA